MTEKKWTEIDFPVWIKKEIYRDNWQLARTFCLQNGLDPQDMNKYPLKDMKYMIFHVWFKVYESGKLEGPYNEKNGEKL